MNHARCYRLETLRWVLVVWKVSVWVSSVLRPHVLVISDRIGEWESHNEPIIGSGTQRSVAEKANRFKHCLGTYALISVHFTAEENLFRSCRVTYFGNHEFAG